MTSDSCQERERVVGVSARTQILQLLDPLYLVVQFGISAVKLFDFGSYESELLETEKKESKK